VEAETHRISEEVTREAQQRLRTAQEAVLTALKSDAASASTTSVVVPGATLPAPQAIRRFLIPLDGTLQGERVIPYIAELARLTHVTLLLAHVTPTEPPAVVGQALRLRATRRQEMRQAFAPEALPYLRQMRSCIASCGSEAIDVLHMTAPTIADGLIQIERSHEIDLIALALGSHGESDHSMLGNVVDRVVRLGSTPALVIPPEADAGIRPFKLRHILIPLDGSPLAEEALAPLAGLLAQIQGQPHEQITVTLFGVADNQTLVPEYHSYLNALREALQTQPAWADVHIRAETVVGSPPGAIVGAVNHIGTFGHGDNPDDTKPVDLLAISTHGLGGMKRWLFGSVAAYVLPRVTAPVLVAHPTYLEDY
jgi:nucleotide-binding universal stress UspA family protein